MDCDDQQNKFDNGLHQDNDNLESCKAGEKPKGDDEGATSEKPASRIHKFEFRCTKFCFDKLAPGGHKRLHLQALRNVKEAEANNNNNKKKKANYCNGKINFSDGKQRCPLCKRDFPSNKSLCGHMKFHPEREWRGVHPPPSPSHKRCPSSPSSNSFEDNNNGNEDDDDHRFFRAVAAPNKPVTLNASKYLKPSWHKTDKRGRQRTYSNEVVNAAQILMHMSRDNWSRDNLNGNGKGGSSEEVSANVDNEKEAGLPSASGVQECHEKAVMVKKNDNKRLKIVVKLKNPYSSSASRYQCGFCGKSFSMYQAYGGHISSHYREKSNNRPHETAESSQSAGPTTIRDFDLNELPSDVPDKTN